MFHVRPCGILSTAAFQKRWRPMEAGAVRRQEGSGTRGRTMVEATVGPKVSLTKLQSERQDSKDESLRH